MECQYLEIHAPSGLNLSQNTEYASQAALWGIEVSTLIYHSFNMKDVPQIVLNYTILSF